MTPYFLSAYNSKTLYHGGNFVMKSIDRGDTWEVISPNLSRSFYKEKQSFATGTIVESPIEKGLLYAGTDHGAFWVSKDDGSAWEEHSNGIANNYIRSISPSNHKTSRVYMAMTGINYDDLNAYLYSSEDYGKSWKSIAIGLPNEPVNVIKEDPTNENILYAGGLRGVYISIDRGNSWSYLGINMPAAAVADLEIHLASMELVVGTHGRGLYKTSLRPIQQLVSQSLPTTIDHFFEIEKATRPWFNSSSGEPDYRTLDKTVFSFWLKKSKPLTLTIFDSTTKEIWKTNVSGLKGLNQYRWDLIVKKQTSDYPYFVHYDQFIKEGTYQVKISSEDGEMQQTLEISARKSPYLIRSNY
jgi:hypothetical protein